MRLTLRTLLAYLDDRLSPANAREIGQKITNSPFATELVERIREVKRKRRLASPAKPQPMIDANLVAEYLDDQLTPELVARVEREILTSDSMLAEVAAAHEILGLIRDPVNLEPRLFDRLYSLDPAGRPDVARAPGSEPSAVRNGGSETPQWRPLASRVTASRRLPGMIAALLALAWIGLVVTDSDLFGPRPVADNETGNGAATDAQAPAGNVHVADADAPDLGESNLPQAIGTDITAPKVASSTNESADAPVRAAVVQSESGQPANATQAAVPEGDLLASAPKSKMPDDKPVATAEGPAPVLKLNPELPVTDGNAGASEPVAFYLQSDSRAVLVLDEAQQRWSELSQIPGGEAVERVQNMVNCGPLLGQKWFGVPQQFRAGITTNSGGWSAILLGPTLVRVNDGTSGGLDLLSGRMRLSVDRAVAWNDQKPVIFILGTGSQNSLITLQTLESRVAIEMVPLASPADSEADRDAVEPPGSRLPLDADLYAQVTVLEGSIGLKSPGSDDETLLIKGQRASWTILKMKEFSSLVIDNGVPIAAAPAWLFEPDVPEIPEQTILKNRLLDSLHGRSEPGESVLPLLADRDPQVGVMAVHVLSLTRDTDRLLSILYESRDEAIHRATIDGLSLIANSSFVGRSAIRKGLETRLPMAEIDSTVQLIYGVTDAQAADPRVAENLLALLSSDRLATRTLAIYRMEQFTRDRMGYHPETEASRRREAIRRWQKYLDRNSGKLVP